MAWCGLIKESRYEPYLKVGTTFRQQRDIEEDKQELADRTSLYEKYVPKSIDKILAGLVDGEMGTKLKQVIPLRTLTWLRVLQ